MARTQAADYGERRAAIVEAAAKLYAERGFLGASVADLAHALGASKSLIYHYYSSKEEILFEVMDSHLRALAEAAEAVVAQPLAPAAKLRELSRHFMGLYVGAAARHKVLLNELDALPAVRRAEIVGRQRRLIEVVESLLCALQPALAPRLRRPAAMLFFGMINWTHTWFHEGGGASAREVADLATDLTLEGLRGLDRQPS
ncbi:MAG TPA: TetR/AcrR family transcriptional regulator [Caulobacteraceae bacterium]|jgi:AcrR family transcriptional regulator|nr:TetR/AcrR family transcriptional regulator [Caulobacteraceae bacterium]